ncbi:hypothetical protein J2W32_001487 [Variovorax boronicumulans]|nr:hypothetical protein [Variovorax boronicumulans]
MNATRVKSAATPSSNEGVPQQPQVAPPMAQAADLSPFIWQQLSDIQNKLGALQVSVANVDESIKSTKTKVDSLSELKNKMIGAFWALGIMISLSTGVFLWTANKMWDSFAAIAAPALRDSIAKQPDVKAALPQPPVAAPQPPSPPSKR